MSTFICEFCSTNFKNISSLNLHKKKAKYCLNNRNIQIQMNQSNNFRCSYCFKNYSSKQNLNNHQLKCDKYNEFRTNTLITKFAETQQKQIENLQGMVERLANKPTTINNNNQYNLIQSLKLGSENIREIIDEKITLNHISNGRKGCQTLISKDILQNKAWCSDYSRNMIKYKDENEEIIRDPSGLKIIEKTLPIVIEKGKECFKKFEETYYKKNKEGDLIIKSPEEVRKEKLKEYYADYTPTDSDVEIDGEIYVSFNKVRERTIKPVKKIISEINQYRENYKQDKVQERYDSLIGGLQDIISINCDLRNFGKELSNFLPNKPPKMNSLESELES